MAICEYAYNCKTRRDLCMQCRELSIYSPKDKSIKTPVQVEREKMAREVKKNKSKASIQSKKNVKVGRRSEERGVAALHAEGVESDQVFMSGAGYEKGDFTIGDEFLVENKREKGFNKMYNYLDKIKGQAKQSGRYPLLRIDSEGKYPVYCIPEYIFKKMVKDLETL